MRKNRIIIAIFIILIISILTIFGIFIVNLFLSSQPTDNSSMENLENNTPIVNNNQFSTNNEQNQTIIEPIITEEPSTEENENQNNISSAYYYNQLNDTAKKIYDGLKENKEKLISGNYKIEYGKEFNTILNSQNGTEEFGKDFQSAWNAFYYDNVDLFYIEVNKITLTTEYYDVGGIKTYTVSIGCGENNNYYSNTFRNQAEVENAVTYLENIKKQMVEQTITDDVYTKIAKVHNWLIYFIDYAENETSKDAHTIYGALKNGEAVCEGYARAFKYLMDGLNIPCVLVSGTAQNSQGQTETHAWNYVQINNNWYAVDVTWDDPVVIGGGEQTNDMKYRYFLKGSDNFFTDHTEDGVISELSMKFKFPTLATQDYSN